MANLRDLIYTVNGTGLVPAVTPREFSVYNTNTNSVNNGGCCCAWTVPSGVTWVTFEIWGGGGGGPGGCCCMFGNPSGSGAYAVKTVRSQTLGGCAYTICAAGTSCSSPSQNGFTGYTTYVTGYGLSNFCATGGSNGCSFCWGYGGAYTCESMFPYCCCAYGGDVCIPGSHGGYQTSQFCRAQGKQWAPTGPAAQSGPQFGPNGCSCGGYGGYSFFCAPAHPGAGGMSAQMHWPCACGQFGAGGLVSVTYG